MRSTDSAANAIALQSRRVALPSPRLTAHQVLALVCVVDLAALGFVNFSLSHGALIAKDWAPQILLVLFGFNVLTTICALWMLGGYAIAEISNVTVLWRRLAIAAAIAPLALPTIMSFLGESAVGLSRYLIISWVCTVLALTVPRLIIHEILKSCSAHAIKRRIAIIGGSASDDDAIRRRIAANSNCELIGVFDDERSCGRFPSAEIKGTVSDLFALAQADLVDEVMISLPVTATERICSLARRFQALPIDVTVPLNGRSLPLPPFTDFRRTAGFWTIRLMKTPLDPGASVTKAIEDTSIALLALTLLLPLLLLIALAIKLESRGPALFKQKRYGYRDQIFEIYKFRTMYSEHADAAGCRLTQWNDNRVTKIGRFLRKYSLDELPQLLNVLKGDMSIVGPRPHALGATAGGVSYRETAEHYLLRHRIKPGLTGWAQVNGWRGPTDTVEQIHGRLAHDVYYVQNWSLGLDIKILALTGMALLNPPATAY